MTIRSLTLLGLITDKMLHDALGAEDAKLVEVLERKGILTKQEVLALIQELRQCDPRPSRHADCDPSPTEDAMPELSYGESLRIGWFLLWRGRVFSFVVFALLGIVLEFVVAVVGPLREYMLVLYVSGALGIVTFGLYPWLVRMMLWKPFRGFQVELIRDVVKA